MFVLIMERLPSHQRVAPVAHLFQDWKVVNQFQGMGASARGMESGPDRFGVHDCAWLACSMAFIQLASSFWEIRRGSGTRLGVWFVPFGAGR